MSWRSLANYQRTNRKANNHKRQYPSWDLQGCGPQYTGGFPQSSAKHMEQRGHTWRLFFAMFSLLLYKTTRGESPTVETTGAPHFFPWRERSLLAFSWTDCSWKLKEVSQMRSVASDQGAPRWTWFCHPTGAGKVHWTEQGPLLCLYKSDKGLS